MAPSTTAPSTTAPSTVAPAAIRSGAVRRRTLLGAALAGLAGAGCGATGGGSGTDGPSAATTGAATSSPSGTPDLDAGEEVVRGLDVPWGLTFLPGGDALVAERETGRVLRISPTGAAPETLYQMPDVATGAGEGGLLGLAASPTYSTDETVYAYLTTADDNRVVRFRPGGGPPEVVFDGIARASFHNGGRIAFGPDGLLYVGTGDAGQTGRAQDPGSPNGKILRLTAAGQPAPDNPTPDSPVYSLGHRNVQGLAWDADGRLFAAEFGQNALDEVNLIEPGRNHGWPEVEGRGDTDGGRYTDPLLTWPVRDASPSGIAIAGNLLYVAALRGRRLWTVPLRDGRPGQPTARFEDSYGRLRTVEVAPDGALWLTTSNRDGRGDPRDGDDRILRFPAR